MIKRFIYSLRNNETSLKPILGVHFGGFMESAVHLQTCMLDSLTRLCHCLQTDAKRSKVGLQKSRNLHFKIVKVTKIRTPLFVSSRRRQKCTKPLSDNKMLLREKKSIFIGRERFAIFVIRLTK